MEFSTRNSLESAAAQVHLVQRAAKDISALAAQLATEQSGSHSNNFSSLKHSQRLATLGALLMYVSFDQEKYEQSEHTDQKNELKRLEQVLYGLELICTLREDRIPSYHKDADLCARFPMLNALVDPLNSQTTTHTQIKRCVNEFPSKYPKQLQHYVDFLRTFTHPKKLAKKYAELSQRRTEARPSKQETTLLEDVSYPKHVYNTLYDLLERYAWCCCGVPNQCPTQKNRHWGRLELKEHFTAANNEVIFHTVFSKKGSVEFMERIEWQHLQFRISKKRRARREVGFRDTEYAQEVKQCAMPEPSTEIKSGSDFCQLLKKDIGSWCKDIRIQDDVLLHFKSPVNIEVDIADEKSISLASVLERYSLAPKFKLLIAYILAKSVWQLYESDFMNVQWTTEAIHLFSEREDEDGDPDERGIDWAPYFALLYDNAPDDLAKERLPRGEIFHRYPRVLALGTLLYELGRNRSKRQRPSPTRVVPSSPTEAPSLERLVNNEARRIAIGVDRNHWPSFDLKDTETLEKYRLIVLECVSNSLFIPTPEKTSPKSPQELEDMLTIEERRSILFQKVVLPLKKLVQSTGWVDEDGKIQRRLVGGVAARLNEANTHHIKPAKLLTNNSDADGSKIPLDDLGMNATEWLGKIMTNPVTETVVSEYRRQRTLSGERIRIAVLDTGYDPESIFFSSKVRKQRIKGWNDYVKKIVADTDEVEEFDSVKTTATPEDNDGHGTHVLSVLMKVAPAADIYVARIARKTKDLQNASQNIADAIKWAWKDCKANIITMSFGFDDEIHVNCKSVISKAILKAELKADPGVLFFAAAANDGGNRKEMFPARDMHVLSIRGTDEFGWPRPFNPPEGYNPSKCFMTLGLDVPGASLSTSDHEGAEICKSGTSVATPIAAGIAATMLGYARIYEDEVKEYLNEHQVRKLGNIWGRSGMTALFAQMATEMTNKWSYLHLNEFADMTKRLILATIATAVKNS